MVFEGSKRIIFLGSRLIVVFNSLIGRNLTHTDYVIVGLENKVPFFEHIDFVLKCFIQILF